MADGGHPRDKAASIRRRNRTGPIRVLPAAVTAMSNQDRDQAVAAIATMISLWWQQRQHDHDH